METMHASNEHTPLLENGATSNEHRQLTRSSATFVRQTSLDGNASISNGHDAASNSASRYRFICVPSDVDQETDEVSLEAVTQALFSAWKQHTQPRHEVTLDFFKEKELYAMHLALKKVTRGRDCNLDQCRIAEAVADAIAVDIQPEPDSLEIGFSHWLWDLEWYARRHLLAANFLRNWRNIADGYREKFPPRYTRTIFDSDEQTPAVSEFLLRLVNLYDKIQDLITNSSFQMFLHCLLIIWPISILLVGVKYMDCPMGYHLSYLLLLLGGVGCLTVLFRLILIHMTSKARCESFFFLEWIGLKFMEFNFLILFIVQAVRLFCIDPVTEPDPNQCVQNFYNVALWINYVSIVFIIKYLFVYFTKICLNLFDVSYWIFKLF